MPPAAPPPTRFERACLALAFVIPIAWFSIYHPLNPPLLVDEPGHVGNIIHFYEGRSGWPEAMTMLPGYHYLVVTLWWLQVPLHLVALARLVPTLTALLGLAYFALAWMRLHRPGQPGLAAAGPATLLLSLLPIFQPFTGMAYSDAPALAFAIVAVAAQFSGLYALAALAFVPALFTRQTNLLWPAFLVLAEFLHPTSAASLFRRTRWLFVVLALSAVAIVVALKTAGRLTPGTQTGNDLQFNPAALHFAGLLVLLCGLPLWLARLPAALRDFTAAVRTRTVRTLAFVTVGLGTAAGLALTFRNAHIWNRDLFWDGCSFTLLRNWPLVWLDQHPWLRALSGLNLVLMAVALARTFAGQPRRNLLWLALAFGLIQPFTNGLVEPRYFIPAGAFVLLGLDLAPATARWLAAWWFLLCAVHAPFIVRDLSLW